MFNKLLRYYFFAFVAIISNLSTQYICVYFLKNIYISIFSGTVVGLLVKFFLDRSYIFEAKTYCFNQFFLYVSTAIITTFIFWSIEFLFYIIFASYEMMYFGGFLGLLLGYYLKFKLDQKYVF